MGSWEQELERRKINTRRKILGVLKEGGEEGEGEDELKEKK